MTLAEFKAWFEGYEQSGKLDCVDWQCVKILIMDFARLADAPEKKPTFDAFSSLRSAYMSGMDISALDESLGATLDSCISVNELLADREARRKRLSESEAA